MCEDGREAETTEMEQQVAETARDLEDASQAFYV
jgi:hypothetical protein